MTLSLSALKSEVQARLATAEGEIASHWSAVVAWIEGEEQTIATEIAHLRANGYAVEKAAAPSTFDTTTNLV